MDVITGPGCLSFHVFREVGFEPTEVWLEQPHKVPPTECI